MIFSIALGTRPGFAADPGAAVSASAWLAQAEQAERGLADFVTIGDEHRLPRRPPDGPRGPRALPGGRLDPIMIACRLAPATRRVGLVPMACTTVTEPFLLCTQIATLDHVSGGRAGWELTVAHDPRDAGLVGPRAVPELRDRYPEAIEHADVVRRLWDSWEDGAEIRDAASHRFIDRDQIHHIDFAGAYFSVRGPSITPRPPQGQPLILARVDREAMYPVAAAVADVAILSVTDPDALGPAAKRLRDAAGRAEGRPGELRVLADVDVALDRTGPPLDSDAAPLTLTGISERAAGQLADWAAAGLDGFRLRPVALPGDLSAICGPLSAELQRRGAVRSDRNPATLRERLGLPRPANRYASVG